MEGVTATLGGARLCLAVVALCLLVASCGGEPAEPEPTTTAPTAVEDTAPGTTGYADNPCFKFPVQVLQLQNDYRRDVRSIVGADEPGYRRRAQALIDEAQRLGCPRPVGLESFLR